MEQANKDGQAPPKQQTMIYICGGRFFVLLDLNRD